MKILIDYSRDEEREHAQTIVRKQKKRQYDVRFDVVPLHMPSHLAHLPQVCDECGQTYWSTNPYATHLRCPGAPPKQAAGFTR